MASNESKLLSCADADISFRIELIDEELFVLAKTRVLGLLVFRMLLLLHFRVLIV